MVRHLVILRAQERHQVRLTKSTIGDFVTLLARAQTPQSEIDADLTQLTKCRFNRHFVIKAKRHEGQAALGLPLGFLNSERFRCF